MSAIPQPRITPEKYLARERAAEGKHEYYQGEVFAMGGASPRHNLIALNTGGELRQRLHDSPCLVFTSDQRVKVDQAGLVTYPDVTVVCSKLSELNSPTDTLALSSLECELPLAEIYLKVDFDEQDPPRSARIQ